MKCLLSSLFCLLHLMVQAQAFDVSKEGIDYTQYDTLHIYPSLYEKDNFIPLNGISQYLGYPLHNDVMKQYGIDTLYPAKHYTVTNQFVVDSASNTIGYIFTCETYDIYNSHIVYAVIDEDNKLMCSFIVAFYKELPGTMEETKNTWLFDEDGDGDLDMVMLNDLVDYELPTEYEDNITGVRSHFYRFEDGRYIFEYMTKDMYLSLRATR